MGFLNNLGFGLIVTLIGMLTVFFGLVLLKFRQKRALQF